MKKLIIKKSLFPEDNKTHIVVAQVQTKHGCCEGRVFKGTYNECKIWKLHQVQSLQLSR